MKIDMKVHLTEQEGKCLARLSATLDDCFAVRGLRLMEGKNGLFLNFPSYKGRSGYVDICFPTTAELRQQMTDGAVAAYRQALEHHREQAKRLTEQGQAEGPVQAAGPVMGRTEGGQRMKKKIFAFVLAATLLITMAVTAFAAGNGNVAGVIEQTWKSAAQQIKTVVNSVLFPALDMILVILLFVKIASAYLDYRKHGQMEWTPAAILFAGLIFSITAPTYIWTILGI